MTRFFSSSFFKKLVLSVTIAVSALSININIVRAESPNINAQSYILIDSKTGQVLYEHNSQEKLYPASTTKIITAVLALEKGNLDQLMVASQAAVNDIGKDGMNIGIVAGEEIRLENLLNALLIKSANETANIIAENISPTRSDFIELMNKRAQELGAVNTNFINACGKDSSKEDIDHLTTASDLSKIARHAMTIPKFREYVSKKSFVMPDSNKHPASYWPQYYSTNKLLLQEKYKTPLYSVTGIKTGYTDKAGNCLISAGMNGDGVELISVILGVKNAPADSIFAYSKTLLEYGFSNYALQDVVETGHQVTNVPVLDAADNATLDLILSNGLKSVLPTEKSQWNITSKEHINPEITAPVQKGDILGYVEYERNGVSLGKVDLTAASSVEKSVKAKGFDKSENSAESKSLQKFIYGGLITVLTFITLRKVLRKLSRALNSRKQRLS